MNTWVMEWVTSAVSVKAIVDLDTAGTLEDSAQAEFLSSSSCW
ncbi:hypothetical protein JOC55_003244 [Paenibacillus sacheonensis]|nr:hypothetical protein [Paenibacillus sacheonensis]